MLEYREKKLRQAQLAHPTDNEYVLSDGEPDREGDVIEPEGWQLSEFDPIALFNHDRADIIGKWQKVRVEGKALRGSLRLADAGTSPLVDYARALVDQGLLDTVSVGFRPLDAQPLTKDPFGPKRFKRVELVEASLVSIPANPRARRIAKHFLPEDQYRRLCAKSGAEETRSNDSEPKSAATTRSEPAKSGETQTFLHTKGLTMEGLQNMPIGKRIETTQAHLVKMRDRLHDIEASIGDAPSDEQRIEVESLGASIDEHEKNLSLYQKIEDKQKATIAKEPANQTKVLDGDIIVPKEWIAKSVERPFDLFTKVLAADLICKIERSQGSIISMPEVLASRSKGSDPRLAMAIAGRILEKAVQIPATTTTAGWAAELATTVNADFLDVLKTASIYGGLAALGQRYTFGRAAIIKIPTRLATPTINGSFVGEGSAIPVRKAGLSSISLTPKKMAVISTFTREIDLHSIPAIQQVIRDAIVNDTSNAIDAVLNSTTASSAVTPAGLKATENNPAAITPNAAAGTTTYDKMIADLKALINAIAGNGGDASRVVFIMNPAQALSLQWATIADGSFPFGNVAESGNIRGQPVIVSRNIAAGSIIALDASLFASVTDDTPQFDVNDSATVHEDDVPLPIIAPTTPPGTGPAVPSFPVRSLWQTYSAAIRMILPMNWAMLRTASVGAGFGFVATMTGITAW